MEGAFAHIPGAIRDGIANMPHVSVKGKVVQVVGTIIKASVPGVKIGEICLLRNPWENVEIHAEVVGFTKESVLLTALGAMTGISQQTEVVPTRRAHTVGVGNGLLGRVLDGLGRPIDFSEKGPLSVERYYPVYAEPPNPLERRIISEPITLGVRSLDALLTCGEGQRMGIFAAAGGGKSTLLAQIVRNTEADVTVLALIGERGREVREFIEKDLGEEGLARSVVVCSTSDRSAMERLKAAYVATTIAEYFRDKGRKVLLLMDSVTRFGRAQREIGLAAGEPPTRRGFPPSVFSELPKLMERAGNSAKGSVTALYTVLVEGDDLTEPIADETRSILDGHIVLSRRLAEKNHYPAIDVLSSISRCQNAIVTKEHRNLSQHLREILSKYQEVELLLKIGEYAKGSDAATDEAIAKIDKVNAFLRQGLAEKIDFSSTLAKLKEAVA